jgi:dienelactone hydrolase
VTSPTPRFAPQPKALAVAAVLVCSCCDRAPRAESSPVAALTGIREEDVRFRSGVNTLAGTLFLPGSEAPHAAVVLFHGSGPEPRNRFMGRWFAEQGVAALTYDKRGVGESTGDFRGVPFFDLCDDGLAALEFLKRRSEIHPNRIGVWGLSQGGWLGPLAAARSKDVRFVIAVSGPGVSPGEQMIFYYANQLRHAGLSANEIEEASTLRRRVWAYLATGTGYDVARAALDGAIKRPWFAVLRTEPDGLFNGVSSSAILKDPKLRDRPWYKGEANYDPRIALRQLSVPALFVFGEDDEVTPVPQSVAIIRQTLGETGHRDFEIRVFPGADHGLNARTQDGSRTFTPGYLDTMSGWLRTKLTDRPLAAK